MALPNSNLGAACARNVEATSTASCKVFTLETQAWQGTAIVYQMCLGRSSARIVCLESGASGLREATMHLAGVSGILSTGGTTRAGGTKGKRRSLAVDEVYFILSVK